MDDLPACPCCAERVTRRGGVRFMPRTAAPMGACGECLLPPPPFQLGKDDAPPSLPLPPFEWPRSQAEIEVLVERVVADCKACLDRVAALADSELSFASVVAPLMAQPNYKTNPLVCQAKHLQHCSPNGALREAAAKASTAFAACKKQATLREDVCAKVRAFAETAEAQALPEYEAHFLKSLLDDFHRGGLTLAPEDRAQLRRLLDEDSEACSKFKRNLGEDASRLSFAAEELEGCEPDFIQQRLDAASGKVVLSLKYPDVLPVLQSCSVGATRRTVALARDRCFPENLELVAKGIQLRFESAKLLGHKSWSDMVTERRMSGCPETVISFLEELRKKALAGAEADKERFRRLKAAHLAERGELPEGGPVDVRLEAWDTSFYHTRLLKQEYGVDHEAIRKYFPLHVVVDGTLGIYQELLGLKFAEITSFDRWHEDVRLFVVSNEASGDCIGHFYLDLHPRDGKYNHAAIFHLLKRCQKEDGTWQLPVDCMLTNLPPPSPDGTPALLRHDDVVTFFHEFGHIMHGLCAEGQGNSTHLAKCPRDFVEAPSQMLENWCFHRGSLQRLSKHIETGEALPAEMAESLLKARNVGEGFFMCRQIYLATLDLTIHGKDPPKDAAGLQALVDEMRPRLSLVDNPPGCNMLQSFGHLMNQYSAAYYGYLWAEVISADMFASRFQADPFSKEAGMAYRKQVLAVGGVGKISEHLAKFLGRPPKEDAFLKARGIL